MNNWPLKLKCSAEVTFLFLLGMQFMSQSEGYKAPLSLNRSMESFFHVKLERKVQLKELGSIYRTMKSTLRRFQGQILIML